MNFRKRVHMEPEINLIPFIDVLLVVLIFLMLTTTYTRFTEVQLNLPVADTDAQKNYPAAIEVKISGEGNYWVNDQALDGRAVPQIEAGLRAAAGTAAQSGNKNIVVVINADALAPHQSVISVMEAAQRAGLARVTFTTKPSAKK